MKKSTLLTVVSIAICVGSLKAQTNQGNVLVGVSSTLSLTGQSSDLMNIGYSSVKLKSDADGFEESDPNKVITINLSPRFGYFVVDNFAVGLDLNIAALSDKSGEYGGKTTETLLSAGPFVRYYFPTSKVLPYLEIGGSFGTIKSKIKDFDFTEDEEFKSGVMMFGGGVGLAAPLGERVVLDVLAGYSSFTEKDKENNDDNERTVFNTLGLKLGLTIFLGAN